MALQRESEKVLGLEENYSQKKMLLLPIFSVPQ